MIGLLAMEGVSAGTLQRCLNAHCASKRGGAQGVGKSGNLLRPALQSPQPYLLAVNCVRLNASDRTEVGDKSRKLELRRGQNL